MVNKRMLQLIIPERESFDNSKGEFVYTKSQTLDLEHSLISISKWESTWKKPFLPKGPTTREETIDYLKCMTLNSKVDPAIYYTLDRSELERVGKYIEDDMTATWFNERNTNSRPRGRKQVVTSELIYYWMISYGIPFECQKWHLNRLLTLIRICEIKNTPSKKMSKRDILSSNKALNESRRKAHGTRG